MFNGVQWNPSPERASGLAVLDFFRFGTKQGRASWKNQLPFVINNILVTGSFYIILYHSVSSSLLLQLSHWTGADVAFIVPVERQERESLTLQVIGDTSLSKHWHLFHNEIFPFHDTCFWKYKKWHMRVLHFRWTAIPFFITSISFFTKYLFRGTCSWKYKKGNVWVLHFRYILYSYIFFSQLEYLF